MMNNSIQKGLEHDAQFDSERIPTDMAELNIRQKAESLKRFMERHNYNQSKIAKLLGVNPAVISEFLKNKYKGDNATLVKKIVELINTVDRRERHIRRQPFIETAVAKRIATVIKQTRAFSSDDEGAIGVIIGDSGHGKSICLREYAEANKNAFYIVLDDAMNATRVFSEIAKQLGPDSSGSMDNVTRRIIEALQNREAVVMIDEASYLTVRQLSQLRTVIVDRSRCPLILAGNSDLLKTIIQPKTRRGCESLDQFRSRLMCILNLDELAARKDKDGGLYRAEDIRKLYEYGGITLTGDAVATLKAIGKTPESGRLRTCSRIIAAIHISPNLKEIERIDADLIIHAIEDLGLPIQAYLPVAVKEQIDETEAATAVAKAG